MNIVPTLGNHLHISFDITLMHDITETTNVFQLTTANADKNIQLPAVFVRGTKLLVNQSIILKTDKGKVMWLYSIYL